MKKCLMICMILCLASTLLLSLSIPTVNASEIQVSGDESSTKEEDNLLSVRIYTEWEYKDYTIEDFAEVNCVSIERHLRFPTGEQEYVIRIADSGEDALQRAADVLNARADVKLAWRTAYDIPLFGDSTWILSAVVFILISFTGLAALLTLRRKYR